MIAKRFCLRLEAVHPGILCVVENCDDCPLDELEGKRELPNKPIEEKR